MEDLSVHPSPLYEILTSETDISSGASDVGAFFFFSEIRGFTNTT